MALSPETIATMKQTLERKKKHREKFAAEYPAKLKAMDDEIATLSKDIEGNDPEPGLGLAQDEQEHGHKAHAKAA